MKRRKIIWITFFCIIYGGLAILSFYQIYELTFLKYSHELVEGEIERIEHRSTGKSSTDWLICSYSYKGQIYNKKIFVSDGIPFFELINREYPKGKTIFMLNYEKDIIFPQNKINLEIQRRVFPLIFFTIILFISIIIIIRE
jgi:hypothetical protein